MNLSAGRQMQSYRKRDVKNKLFYKLISLMSICVALLTGCEQNRSIQSDYLQSDSVQSEQIGTSTIATPNFLNKAIDNSQLFLVVEIDNVEQSLTPNATHTQWSGDILVPSGNSFQLDIEWRLSGVLLARYSSQQQDVLSGDIVVLTPDEYQTTGDGFDHDNDGVSNLEELQSDSYLVDVEIPRITQSGPPSINGLFGVIWAEHSAIDTSGNALRIDNLIVDSGADRPDGNTEFNWQALYDDNYLYLIVFAEDVSRETLNADSQQMINDDTLHIYLDGNNSKGQAYDGVDDFHVRIPLLKLLKPADPSNEVELVFDDNGNIVRDSEGQLLVERANNQFYLPALDFESNNSTDPDGRFIKGNNSIPLPDDIEFSNCRCFAGQHVFEVKINLEQVGIEVGKPFGIEIQLDDDIDGGDRNARYAWKHPSIGSDTNFDGTYRNPSLMGTAVLQE